MRELRRVWDPRTKSWSVWNSLWVVALWWIDRTPGNLWAHENVWFKVIDA